MGNWRRALSKVKNLFRYNRAERELAREIESHIGLIEDDLLRRGMTPDEARVAARRAFGGIEQAKELKRDERSFLWLEQARQDVRFALRTVTKSPGFTVVAILTLGLGIGANSAIFSIIDSLLLRRPAFEHIDRVMVIEETNPTKLPADMWINPSPGTFLDWRDQVRSFDLMAAWRNWYYTLAPGGQGTPESLRGVRVSPSFFDLVGIKPMLGRVFRANEEEPGHGRVVVLSFSLWQRRFASDPAVIGKKAVIDGQPFEITGVLARDFQFFQSDFDLWMPLTVDSDFHNRTNHSVMVFGRLAPGITAEQAQAEMSATAHRMESEYPDTNRGWNVHVVPLYPGFEARNLKPALLILLGAAGFVLLIACTNVANLLLSRAVARQREFAIRAAVGAGRSRLIRQMLTENVLISLAGGAAAILLAGKGIELLFPLLPHASVNKSVGGFLAPGTFIDVRVLAFSFLIALVAAITFGLAPAFRMTRPEVLRNSGISSRHLRAGRVLIMAEIALSMVLVVGAILLLESLWRLQRTDAGFRTDHLLTMQVWLPTVKYAEPKSVTTFYDRLLRRIEELPGVEAAGAVSFRPFNGMGVSATLDIEGRTRSSFDEFVVPYRVVAPGHTRMLGQPLVEGRDIATSDVAESEGVAVINQAMAKRFWPKDDPIGKHIRPDFDKRQTPWDVNGPPRWLTVVGVASNIKENRLDEQPPPEFYVSYRQVPSSFMFLMVRTTVPPERLAPEVQSAVRALDADQAIANVRTMEDAIDSVAPRFNVQLLLAFAAVAMALSAVGVYGVTSYAIGQRTQEFAVRMAIGARAVDVLTMVVRETCNLAVAGILAGIASAFVLTRAMATLLFGISPSDAPTYAAAAIVIFVVTLLACYIPARRATKVDAMMALRT